jgi:16S rRNA processing protein RimM
MVVVDPAAVALGEVTEVTSNGAQDVLVVAGVDASGNAVERLIPFIRGPIIESVSLEERKIVAHWQQDW